MKKLKNFRINYFFIGFLLSAVIMTVAFYVIKVWPAGDHYALIVDSIIWQLLQTCCCFLYL